MSARRLWLLLALVLLVAACDKDKNIDRPAKLVPFRATLHPSRLWTANVHGTKVPLRLGLALAVDGGTVYAAGYKGEVAAFDATSGHRRWIRKTKLPLGGGPGVGADLVVVGSIDGDVLALSAADGTVRWHASIGSEILAPAAVSERVIVVRAVDGRMHGLSTTDGHELWQQQQPVPRLSLRGTSHPALVGDVAICGFDNGRVIAANLADGATVWESTVAVPHGKTELERLDDIDAPPVVIGSDVYVAAFQGKIAMLSLDTGQVWWSHELSSYRGLAADDDALYVSTADGQVVALRRRNGTELWRQQALLHRGLTAPTVTGGAVAVADLQGYVHWLDKTTGALVARTRAGKRRYTNPPLAVRDELILINDTGAITAYRSAQQVAAADRTAKDGGG